MNNCFLRLACVLFCFVACELPPTNTYAANNSRPNIIYILLDDAGYGDLSCYGQTKFQTPNIDRLASAGMRFTQHYAGSTVCAPTRCCLMTGVHTGHSFVRGNREVKPEGQAAMPADIVTIPRMLRQAGYITGAFGKWGLGAPGSPSDPMEHFDEFFGYNCQREAHSYYPTHLWKNRSQVPLDGKTYTGTMIGEESLRFIRDSVARNQSSQADEPFFLFLPTPIPHASMHAPESFVAPFRRQFPQFENKIGKYSGPSVQNPIAAFAGMMTLVDQQVGQILALVEQLGIDDNTLIMLTSDNGPHKEGGHDPEFFDSNGELRGFKRDLYEGGIRAPLVARWPGVIQPGSTSELISAHWDMLPTFCELAGVEAPANIDGISMTKTLRGEAGQQTHEYLYWEFYEQGGKKAVRFGDWKAVRRNIKKDPDAPIEIYHLPTDPGETTDVAAEHPDQVDVAGRYMDDAHVPSEFWTFGKPRKLSRTKP